MAGYFIDSTAPGQAIRSGRWYELGAPRHAGQHRQPDLPGPHYDRRNHLCRRPPPEGQNSHVREGILEPLAKLPHLLWRQGLKAAQEMVEIDVRHTSILHCRLVMSVILADSPAPVFLAHQQIRAAVSWSLVAYRGRVDLPRLKPQVEEVDLHPGDGNGNAISCG